MSIELQIIQKEDIPLILEEKEIIFSCVTPTRGRVELIENLLISLNKAISYANINVEIILIDDSHNKEKTEIKSISKNYNTTLLNGTSSVREKRNLGIQNASGKYIFFVDSDCQVKEDIFLEHLKCYEKNDIGGVVGITNFTGEDNFMWKVIERTKFLDSFKFPIILKGKVDSAPWGPCTNLSFKKDILLAVGGFETNLPFHLGADDADLGLRVNKAGYKIDMNENAIVFHSKSTWNSFLKITKRVLRWGRMDYYLFYKRHLDKTFITIPKPICVFFILIIISLFLSLSLSMNLLLLPFIWLLIFLSIHSIIKLSIQKEMKYFCYEVTGLLLEFMFALGTMIESFKNGSIEFLFSEPIDDPRNLWSSKIYENWSLNISLLLTFTSLLLIVGKTP